MSRNLLFVPLLLAMGVAQADDVKESEQASGTAEAAARKEQPQKKQERKAEASKELTQKEQEQKEEAAKEQARKEEEAKLLSGMSILGNQEAPKSLVLVPWKSSVLGDSLGISPMLDDSRQPVDKDVFMRALGYYEIRSGTTPHDGAPTGGRDTAAAERDATQRATAAHRRK